MAALKPGAKRAARQGRRAWLSIRAAPWAIRRPVADLESIRAALEAARWARLAARPLGVA